MLLKKVLQKEKRGGSADCFMSRLSQEDDQDFAWFQRPKWLDSVEHLQQDMSHSMAEKSTAKHGIVCKFQEYVRRSEKNTATALMCHMSNVCSHAHAAHAAQ